MASYYEFSDKNKLGEDVSVSCVNIATWKNDRVIKQQIYINEDLK